MNELDKLEAQSHIFVLDIGYQDIQKKTKSDIPTWTNFYSKNLSDSGISLFLYFF